MEFGKAGFIARNATVDSAMFCIQCINTQRTGFHVHSSYGKTILVTYYRLRIKTPKYVDGQIATSYHT